MFLPPFEYCVLLFLVLALCMDSTSTFFRQNAYMINYRMKQPRQQKPKFNQLG
jgi:hypothetical protein